MSYDSELDCALQHAVTPETYLGVQQDLSAAPCDYLDLKIEAAWVGTESHDLPDNEERRLLAEYRKATRHYSNSASRLSRVRVRSGDEFEKLIKLVDQARADFKTAGDALGQFKRSQ